MGTQGWTCVCVWYMCVCECAHVCVHKCECVLVKVKVAQSCPTLCDSMCYTSPWNSPGKNTGVGRLSLIQGIFPNPGIEPRSPTLQVDSSPAEPQGKPKITGVGSLSLLQQIVPTQESNWGLLHCRQILSQLSYQARPVCVGADPLFLSPLQPVFRMQMQRDRKPTSDSWT